MGVGKIRNVDIVSDWRPVRGVVIRPEHGEVSDVALDSHHRPRDQFGFRISQFTQLAIWIGAACIEISESYGSQSISLTVIGKNAFNHQFRSTVGIHWRQDRGFANGQLPRLAIDSTGTRKD